MSYNQSQQKPIKPLAKEIQQKINNAPTAGQESGQIDPMTRFLTQRKIDPKVSLKNKVKLTRYRFGEKQLDCIAFPYYFNGDLVNVKYRALSEKSFAQTKDGGQVFWGIDDVTDSDTLYIVEGEMDKLAMETAGYTDVVSVPGGASNTKFLDNCAGKIEHKTKIVLAVDNDSAGQGLFHELARRLGKSRCWSVEWPPSEYHVKDANDALIKLGKEMLRNEIIELAKPIPMEGFNKPDSFLKGLLADYECQAPKVLSTGWHKMDRCYNIPAQEGMLHVVTGKPNCGKSEWVDALMMNLAQKHHWRFAICSFENPPVYHLRKLAHKFVGKPFDANKKNRMSFDELMGAYQWLNEHFSFITSIDEEQACIDYILERAKYAVMHRGIKGLVIDPYNEIEHNRKSNETETDYVSRMLSKVKRFAQQYGVNVWFIAHPTKPQGKSEDYEPTLYNISGGANWANKADFGISVSRDVQKAPLETNIIINKVRFQHQGHGKPAMETLHYNLNTSRFEEGGMNQLANAPIIKRPTQGDA